MSSPNISYGLTGYNAVDSFNQELFDLYNHLLSAASVGQGADMAEEAFTTLTRYATAHFKDEETLMLQYDYPDFSYQQMQHNAFIKLNSQLKEEYQLNGMSNPLLAKIVGFLTYWLYIHIIQYDSKIATYIESNKDYFIESE